MGIDAPFPFFCDFHGDLAEAVRKGRRKEFAGAYAKYGDEVPDPLDASTFRSAVLDWDALDEAAGQKRLALVRELARDPPAGDRSPACRRGLWRCTGGGQRLADGALAHGRRRNAAADGQPVGKRNGPRTRQADRHPIWGNDTGETMPPWSVFWHLGAR